jgi:ferric-dicitrate binding protein FerR (iron transport regulator)
MNRESSFVNVPFDVVIQKFMAQYNKKVDYPPAFKSVKFTGTFSNSNIETAVKSIAIPLQANYSIRAEKIVLFE